MEEEQTKRVVILGGGTAGWLSACVLAAENIRRGLGLSITIVEAPDIPTVGVGEGTWPTMRGTLQTIGLDEATFLAACGGAFKQGSRFDGWVSGAADDSYLHPFTPPAGDDLAALLAAWDRDSGQSFAAAANAQQAVVDMRLAPRQTAMPDFAGALNYGYHLDAVRFAALLREHATTRLGVIHIADRIGEVIPDERGGIAALHGVSHGTISGDFFIDCSGHAALLIGGTLNVPFMDRSDMLLNDRAMAVQVPVLPDSAIASATIATAHKAGWLWDIGLPERRGIGCIYASRFMADDEAEAVLRDYVLANVPGATGQSLSPRRILFPTGHRERFWQGNCIAIGLSAGFLEPLEASAIVMIELSLRALTENFPRSRAAMPFLADRFNTLFRYRWDRVVEFLKLHYVLSQRPEPYWQAQRATDRLPPRLAALIALWRDQPPSAWDFPHVDEIFSAASHAYILYGMEFPLPRYLPPPAPAARRAIADVAQRSRAMLAALPDHRLCLAATAQQAPGAGVRSAS